MSKFYLDHSMNSTPEVHVADVSGREAPNSTDVTSGEPTSIYSGDTTTSAVISERYSNPTGSAVLDNWNQSPGTSYRRFGAVLALAGAVTTAGVFGYSKYREYTAQQDKPTITTVYGRVTIDPVLPELIPEPIPPAESPIDVSCKVSAAEKAKIHTKYPVHTVRATIFGIGAAGNEESAWVSGTDPVTGLPEVVGRFGGVDDPTNRRADGLPEGFTPLHNPNYASLPLEEFDEKGLIDGVRESSPWAAGAKKLPADDSESLFEGKWIEVSRGNKHVDVQWYDTGLSGVVDNATDCNYVFGSSSAQPKNGIGVGISLSPTAAYKLGFTVDDPAPKVSWKFIDTKDLPKSVLNAYTPIDNHTHWN